MSRNGAELIEEAKVVPAHLRESTQGSIGASRLQRMELHEIEALVDRKRYSPQKENANSDQGNYLSNGTQEAGTVDDVVGTEGK